MSICVKALRFILPGIHSSLGIHLHRSSCTVLETFCIWKYSHSLICATWHCPLPSILSIFQNERYETFSSNTSTLCLEHTIRRTYHIDCKIACNFVTYNSDFLYIHLLQPNCHSGCCRLRTLYLIINGFTMSTCKTIKLKCHEL